MQYINNKICLEYNEFVTEGICESKGCYDGLKAKGQIKTLGRGGNGGCVYIEFATMIPKYQDKVREVYGEPSLYISMQPIMRLIAPDMKARQFFTTHIQKNGQNLSPEYQARYARQAEWLNMMHMCLGDSWMLKQTYGLTPGVFWKNCIDMHQKDSPVNPSLPCNPDVLRKKLNEYVKSGYGTLVSNKAGNQNSRKVTARINEMIISLACMQHKPTLTEICKLYKQFITGKLEVVDMESGEVFAPSEFYVKDKPYALAESTVAYYIKQPATIAAIDKGRMNNIQWKDKYHPYVMRKAPVFAFSKITMDDRDLSFKDHNGARVVKSYQIADVASGAIIGKAFSRDKDVELLREALRDMFQMIICNGWGMPGEIEMERHLTQHLMKTGDEALTEETLLIAGNLIPNVRVCLGGNGREKRMEHIFRAKKYQFDNKRPGFQGRFYARLVTNRLNADNDKVRYAYEQIVQNELDDIEAWNNSLHPNQDVYPGMTRWEVLENCQNEQLAVHPIHAIMPYIGIKVNTSIRAGYVTVQHEKYRLPDVNILAKMANTQVTAYYIPGELGIEKIYLYQDGKYVSEGIKVVPYQEAVIEQTDADRANAASQWAYQAAFDKLMKDRRGAIGKVGTALKDDSDRVAIPLPSSKVVKIGQGIIENDEPAWSYDSVDAKLQALMDV